MDLLPQDAWITIASFIDHGSAFKALLLTSKGLAHAAINAHPRGHIKFANHKLTMIRMLPDAGWDYKKIYRWVDVNWTEIENTRDHRRWNWKKLSQRTSFSYILTHLDLPWDWTKLSHGCKITDSDVINNPGLPWNWNGLSWNKGITHKLIEMFPERFAAWNWNGMTCRVTDLQFVVDHPGFPWNWESIPQELITWKVVMDNPGLPWNWEIVCGGHGVTWENIKTVPNYPAYHAEISANPNITPEIVRANPDFPWFWPWMAENPSMTWEFLTSKDYRGNLDYDISYAPCITYNDVISSSGKDLTWYMSRLRKNSNFTWDQLISLATDHDMVDLCGLSGDKRLTWDIVVENSNARWDWDKILNTKI